MTDTEPTAFTRRVLLVEDEAMSRTLLAGVLRSAGFEVAECASAAEATKTFRRFDPDALVSDIDLGFGPSGLDLIVSLSTQNPYLAVVVLSNYAITPDYRHPALSKAAYLRKMELSDTAMLIDALEAVLRDREPETTAASKTIGPLDRLTPSQVQVLRMIAEGLSNAEIAERRQSSLRAVEHLVQRTFAALELEADPSVNMRVAAARVYIREAGLSVPSGEGHRPMS